MFLAVNTVPFVAVEGIDLQEVFVACEHFTDGALGDAEDGCYLLLVDERLAHECCGQEAACVDQRLSASAAADILFGQTQAAEDFVE